MRLMTDVGVPITMRDGTVLIADVHRPDVAEPVPTLLMRTPYGRALAFVNPFHDGLRFVREGYALVIQDTRGRFDSEGQFYPFRHETQDGLDTIAWAAAQPWSSGHIGMIGSSYTGTTQWLPAAERPPALRAIAPIFTAADYRDGWIYRGGAFELGFCLQWTLALCVDTAKRRVADGSGSADLVERVRDAQDRVETLYCGLDADAEDLLRDLAPYYLDWRAHPDRDIEWPSIAPEIQAGRGAAPALDIGGWYDIFLTGTLANFRQQREAALASGRAGPRLIIGPWTHRVVSGAFRDRHFGARSALDVAGGVDAQVQWFDRWLRRQGNGVELLAPVRLFVMGADVWRDFVDWPPPDATPTAFYLRPIGRVGDGTAEGHASGNLLSREPPPADEHAEELIFDPADPVSTIGGATLLQGSLVGERSGPTDLAPNVRRPDVLSYWTPPLERPLTIVGPVQLRVSATSADRGFDLVGQLADVSPDGRWELLTGGILRVAADDSNTQLVVDLGATAATIREGHRLGLALAASDFPRFDLNPIATAVRTTIAIPHTAMRSPHLVAYVLDE